MQSRKIWLSWLGFVLGGALFLAQLIRGFQGLLNATTVINPAFALFALVAILFAFTVQVAGWLVIMRGLGVRLAWPDGFAGYFISFIPRYIPGMIWGYLSRGQWMNDKHSVAFRVTSFSSLIEIVVSLSSAASVILIFASFSSTAIERWLFALLALLLPALAWAGLNNLGRLLILKRWVGSAFVDNSQRFLSFGRWAAVYLLSVLLWTCYGEALWATSVAVGSPLAYNLLALIAIFASAWLIGLLIVIVPAGLGIRELALSGLLITVMGLSPEQSSLVAVGLRVVTLGAELLMVICSVLIRSFRRQLFRQA